MRKSSPPLVRFAPLRGMDARESRRPESPHILYNIDCSQKGVWKERPGLSKWAVELTGHKIMGLHVFQVYGQAVIVSISHASTGMFLGIYSTDNMGATGLAPELIAQVNLSDAATGKVSGSGNISVESVPAVSTVRTIILPAMNEPITDRFYYTFAQSFRRLLFCNGNGVVWELEWANTDVFTLSNNNLETGLMSDVNSYVKNNLSPSFLLSWYNQIVATGFIHPTVCSLYTPIPPGEALKFGGTLSNPNERGGYQSITADPMFIFMGEPLLSRSFPLEKTGDTYVCAGKEVVAAAPVKDKLIVFTKTDVEVIQGHGSQSATKYPLSEHSIASNRAAVNFGDFVFFIAHDGCFITNGSEVRKVSSEMDPLWFGIKPPDITRYVQDAIKNTAYPFYVNRYSLRNAHCVNDSSRKQIMVFLPSQASGDKTDMCWVWNYDGLSGGEEGSGMWSIWSGKEEPYYKAGNSEALTNTYSAQTSSGACATAGGVWVAHAWDGDSYDGFCYPPVDVIENSASQSTAWHVTASAQYSSGDKSRVFLGTDDGKIHEFGVYHADGYRTRGSGGSALKVYVGFKTLIGLGRMGPVDMDSRVVFTDVAVRKKQMYLNTDDMGTTQAPVLTVAAQSEGEAMDLIKATDVDVEFVTTMDNMGDGISRATKSSLNAATAPTTLVLGAEPSGTASPMPSHAYHDGYARLNLPDGDGRSAIVDLYSSEIDTGTAAGTVQQDVPHNLRITEIRIHGSVKGGATRSSGGASSSGKVMPS